MPSYSTAKPYTRGMIMTAWMWPRYTLKDHIEMGGFALNKVHLYNVLVNVNFKFVLLNFMNKKNKKKQTFKKRKKNLVKTLCKSKCLY